MKTKLLIGLIILILIIPTLVVAETINAGETKYISSVGYSVYFLYGSSGGPNTCGFWVTKGTASYTDVGNSERERVKPNGQAISAGETYNLQVLPLTFTLSSCGTTASFTLTSGGGGSGGSCINKYEIKCDNDIFYYYNSCGIKGDIYLDCNNLGKICNNGEKYADGGCELKCKTTTEKTCYGGNVYYLDTCGNPSVQVEFCGTGKTCSNNQCVANCISHYFKACYNNDVYWKDSCNKLEGIADDCSITERCEPVENECIPLCASHAYKKCDNDNALYWYDKCDQREERAFVCNSSQLCTIEGCVERTHCPDGICNYGESCATCPGDCGKCIVEEPYCGDGECNAGETCETCSRDCRICPENQCKTNEDCGSNEICDIGECRNNLCKAGEIIKNHKCTYECYSDMDCGDLSICSMEQHKCVIPSTIEGDVLIITMGNKLDKTEKYKEILTEYRNILKSEGLSSLYIELDSQKVQQGFGIQTSNDWESINDALNKIVYKTKAKYILILGGVGVIPMPSARTSEKIPTIPVSDDRYADLDLDGLPDIAIGRIPIPENTHSTFIIETALNSAIKMHRKGSVSKVILTDVCLFPPSCAGINDVNKISNSIFGTDCIDNSECYPAPPNCGGNGCKNKDIFYSKLLNSDFINLNAHADPYFFQAQNNNGAYTVLESKVLYKTPFLTNPIFSTIGCHSGTIDCEEGSCINLNGNVFAFLANGASIYIGNTRYGWGGLTAEHLSELYNNIKTGKGLGESMMEMKRKELSVSSSDFENAVIYEIQLYGDPTLKVNI